MDQGPSGGDFGAFLSEFLTGDDALLHGLDPAGLLDPASLSAVSQLDPALAMPAVRESTRKRIAEQDSESEDEGAHQQGSGKRTKGDGSTAARNKATREKARREKINERFAELASLIDPGKEPKTDKPTILADAIKYVHQMRVENHQLKQLNKFLEERVAQLERERGQTLYQHSLMMQHGGMMMPPMQGMHPGMQSSNSMPGPSGLHAPSPQPHHGMIHPQAMAAAAAAAQAAAAAALQQHTAVNGGMSGLSGMPGFAMPPSSGSMLQTQGSMDGPGTSGNRNGSMDPLPPAPLPQWAGPQLIDTKDSLIRPPAA